MTASGEPARWTVDDNSDLTFGDTDITVSLLSSIPRGSRVRRNAFAALVADVRAARVHEGCTHTTDTLRRARELAHAYGKGRPLLLDPRIAALLDLLVDGGTDG